MDRDRPADSRHEGRVNEESVHVGFFDRFSKAAPKIARGGRAYKCTCGNPVFFGNSICLKCGSALGYEPHLAAVVAITPIAGTGEWRIEGASKNQDVSYRRCANFNLPAACNWLLSDHGIGAQEGLCIACRLNRTIPDLSVPENGILWGRFEVAKRRLVSTLLSLEMPVASKEEHPKGLAFDFLRSPKDGPRVLTSHDNGLITFNIEEADPAVRERIRERLNEPYRTLLGHFRHEVGHYYWDRLIGDTAWIDEFRRLFGDERADYGEALARNYKDGPPADWPQRYVSSYASTHPWEDWAETWAHLLHMSDTLATAWSFGLNPETLDLQVEPYSKDDLYRPDEPNAGRFLRFLNAWIALSAVMNEMSRGMGSPDFYPFALPRAAVQKLHFMTVVVRQERELYQKHAAM
jgi:hypothetical protein